MKKLFLTIFFFCLIAGYAQATPRQIIIVRHADKLEQKLTGPAVSAKGYVRSVQFLFYLLQNFGEPDFVIAGKPKGKNASIRELQTVAPLVNILAARHPDTGFPILHPYTHKQYKELAEFLLQNKKFNDKLLLICWRHSNIVRLTKLLGVTEKLPPWADDDYDSVFVINYDHQGKVVNFSALRNQYPVNNEVSWETIHHVMQGFAPNSNAG